MSRLILGRLGRANSLFALILMLLCGCGENHPTASVSGNVTFEGKPFEGKIVFMPSGTSTEKTPTMASLQGGRYEMPSVSPGTKTVRVVKNEPLPDRNKPRTQPPVQFWFAKPRTVEVQPGSQTMDFTLTNKP